MSNDSTHKHGAEGGQHACIFCGNVYSCALVHQEGLGKVLPGGRCCTACRIENMKALDRLGVARRSMFQEGT